MDQIILILIALAIVVISVLFYLNNSKKTASKMLNNLKLNK